MNGILRLLLGHVIGLASLFGGFWLLYQAFSVPNAGLGVLGGALIIAAMWVMVRTARR